jgi:Mg-chelatase subunit ChlD
MAELNRWKLILGSDADLENEIILTKEEEEVGDLLDSIYPGKEGKPFGRSTQKIRKWLEGIRTHFPPEVVQVLQNDALERQGVKEMLLEPELLDKIEPSIQLVAAILQLQELLPDKTKSIARQLVQRLVSEIEQKLKPRILQAVQESKKHQSKRVKPSQANIDWNKTILRNLKNFQPSIRSIVPENWYGYKKGHRLPEVVILVDKSESMISSAIYASIIGAVLASVKSIRTQLIFFDTSITDVTDRYKDPVDIMFSVPMGGGTDIAFALQYAYQKINNPTQTLLFLLSDLYEGGNKKAMLDMCNALLVRGVKMISLLCLSDEGKPDYDMHIAESLANLKIPCFGTSPDLFPEMLSKELEALKM